MFDIWTARSRIRRLGPADAAGWAALRAEAVAAHPEALGDSHDDRAGWSATEFEAHLAQAEVWGITSAGRLVGCLTAERVGQAAELSEIYVRPEDRGRGVARALIAHAARRAKRAGLGHLVLIVAEENAPARRTYLAAGFRDAGPEGRGLAADGRLLTRRRMVRDLAP